MKFSRLTIVAPRAPSSRATYAPAKPPPRTRTPPRARRLSTTTPSSTSRPPGTQRPRRFVPHFHWELLVCDVGGHELVGTDAAHVGVEHAVFVREVDGVRWYRCLRCDSWLPLPDPEAPSREEPPPRDEIELPLRGKALRDKVVLRI